MIQRVDQNRKKTIVNLECFMTKRARERDKQLECVRDLESELESARGKR